MKPSDGPSPQSDLEIAEDAHPDLLDAPQFGGDIFPPADEPIETPAAPRPASYYVIGTIAKGENPPDVALYLWGKQSFGAQLVQANLDRQWEDGVEIIIPDIDF